MRLRQYQPIKCPNIFYSQYDICNTHVFLVKPTSYHYLSKLDHNLYLCLSHKHIYQLN